MKKIPEKLQGYTHYKTIKTQLKTLVYESLSVQQFESRWRQLMNDHD